MNIGILAKTLIARITVFIEYMTYDNDMPFYFSNFKTSLLTPLPLYQESQENRNTRNTTFHSFVL